VDQVGPYQVKDLLGRGGAGAVYRCGDPRTGQDVAVKMLLHQGQSTERQRKRFQREAEALIKLRHANVVRVLGRGEERGDPYLVLEFVGGRSLQDRLDREGALPEREAAALATALEGFLEGRGSSPLRRASRLPLLAGSLALGLTTAAAWLWAPTGTQPAVSSDQPPPEVVLPPQPEAEPPLEAAPAPDPYAKRFSEAGRERADQGDFRGALEAFDEAIRLDPNDALTWVRRGYVKNNLGDHRGALADCEEAIRLDPTHGLKWMNRGISKSNLGHYQAAIADHDEAIRLDPGLAYAWVSRGISKSHLGDVEGTIADFQSALDLEPEATWAPGVRRFIEDARARSGGSLPD
jgi:tetratricopeptide (TPR) repeat protein